MTAEPSDEIKVTLRVARAFEKLGVRYLVGGSLASSLHGTPRSSNHVDIVAELNGGHVDPLVADLSSGFYVSAEAVRDALKRCTSFNAIHLETMFKVDVFVMSGAPFHVAEMERRQAHPVWPGSADTVYFATAEDTILQKLRWFRLGNEVSERQWLDVVGVIRRQGDRLDLAYLRESAADVADLFERAWRDGAA